MADQGQASVTIALIIIGDEILMGRTKEANLQYLAQALQKKGLSLDSVEIIQDDQQIILTSLEKATSNHQLVILSGGLGPTQDDKTKKSLASFLKTTLKEDPTIIAMIKKQYEYYDRTWTTETNSYHILPQGVQGVFNPVGLAPGLMAKKNNTTILCLPGVPREFRGMLDEHLSDVLKDSGYSTLESKQNVVLRTQGVPEEEIFLRQCPRLWDLLGMYGSPSSLPGLTGVDIIIKDVKQDPKKITEAIIQSSEFSAIKNHLWHIGQEDPVTLLTDILKKNKKTLATAESCTGGLLASTITDVPGSSDYFLGSIVSYANSVKQATLDVEQKTLETYGAVSEEVALEMAKGVFKKIGSDLVLSTTGIAGPTGGTTQKPVGTVCCGFAYKDDSKFIIHSTTMRYRGDRETLKKKFVLGVCLFALTKLREKGLA